MSELEPEIKEALWVIYGYASHVDEWIVIKKELIKTLPVRLREGFSIRDPITKKQRTNDYERQLASHWSSLTGREVVFTD